MRISNDRRFMSQRVGRRRILRGGAVGVAGLAAASLIGCGADDEVVTTPTPADDAPGVTPAPGPDDDGILARRVDTTDEAVPGGTWRGFETSDIPNFDHLGTESFRTHVATAWLYPNLITFAPGLGDEAPTGDVMPWLAEDFELADETRLIFRLRPDALWDERSPTSSRPVDTEDVLYSWDRFAAEHVRRTQLAHSASDAAPVEAVEAIDEHTVEMRLAFPFSPVMSLLAHAWTFNVMPREADGGFDPRTEARGAGPWKLARYDPAVRLVYERNPNHWESGRPFLDEVRLPILGEYAQRLAQFRAGEIDAGAVQQPDIVSTKNEIPELQAFQGDFSQAAFYLMFGLREGSPFRDERVRQAVSMSIDRDSYIRAFNELDTFTDEGWPVGIRKHNVGVAAGLDGFWLDPDGPEIGEAGRYFQHDPEEVNRLVSAAGYPDGIEVPFFFITTAQYGTQYPERAEAYMAMLNATGAFRVAARNPDYTTEWVGDYYRAQGDFPDGIAYQANSAAAHPGLNLQAHYYGPSGLSKVALRGDVDSIDGTRESDELIDRILATFDFEEQVELTHDWQRMNAVRQPAVSEPGTVQPYSLAWPWAMNWGGVRSYLVEDAVTQWPRRWLDETKRN